MGNRFNHDPLRPRKLLMHRNELRRLVGQVEQKGLTLVPLDLHFTNGLAKVNLALVRGKQLHDKRETLKERADQRDVARSSITTSYSSSSSWRMAGLPVDGGSRRVRTTTTMRVRACPSAALRAGLREAEAHRPGSTCVRSRPLLPASPP
jgi:hypothetical protein